MILKSIKIQNLGFITYFSHKFKEGMNVVKDYRRDELSFAIRLIFNHKAPPPPSMSVGVDTRIEANVSVSMKEYSIIALPTDQKRFKLFCQDLNGRDVTSEYLYLTAHSYQQDMTDVFRAEEKEIIPSFLKYANEDLYYSRGELSRGTGGLSDIKSFRRYLRDFIKNFKPELLRDGKGYEIVLDGGGRYAVRCTVRGTYVDTLSESEKTMFRYLCFLRTAEFWCGFEEIRNLHGIKKPLLVSGLLERLDESIDVGELLCRTEKLRRQTILITNENIKRGPKE